MKKEKTNTRASVINAPPPLPGAKYPKYRIAGFLQLRFGELGIKDGKKALADFCGLKKAYTVDEWINIPAGSDKEITHLLVDKVLDFFDLTRYEQLLTDAHKQLLKPALA